MIVLNKIFIYPIKALAGVEVGQVKITSGGTLMNDRRWAMLDDSGRLINGKNNKAVFALKPIFDLVNEQVGFSNEKGEIERFSLTHTAKLEAYLSEQLGKPIVLREDDHQGFPDDLSAYGPTLIATDSLKEVARWFPELSFDEIRARFRINLEVSPAPAFWEDQVFRSNMPIRDIQLAEVLIKPTNPCARCSVPMKAPGTGDSYHQFYETFIRQRELTKPAWTDAECFDHWYRLSINTKIDFSESGKKIQVGDSVKLI